MFTHHQAMLYRRTALEKIRYNKAYKIASDYDLTFRFLKKKNTNPLYINQPLCIFEGGGISQQNAKQGRKEQFLIRKNLGISFIENAAIYTAHTINWKIRQTMPSLYWKTKS